MKRPRCVRTALFLGFLIAAFCSGPACDVGRHPDDVGTDFAGIFDPQTQEPTLRGLVDFSMEIEKVPGAPPISIAVAQGAFAKLGMMDLPEEGSCEFIEGMWARYAVASLEAADVGPTISIRNEGPEGGSFEVPIFLAEPDFPDLITYRSPATNNELELLFGGMILSTKFFNDSSYTVSAPGGPEGEAFDAAAALRTPEYFDLTEPADLLNIRIDRSEPADLLVEWGPVSERSTLFLVRIIVIQGMDIAAQIVCNARDQDGFIWVPYEVLVQLPDGTGAFLAGRSKENFFDLPDGSRAVASAGMNYIGMVNLTGGGCSTIRGSGGEIQTLEIVIYYALFAMPALLILLKKRKRK